jgi:NTP pyrophosphatase (non-canonical NTP hydrolase)
MAEQSPSQSSSDLPTPQAASVLEDVAHERQRQDEKWGPCQRPPLEWLGIIAEEFGEVAEKVVKGWVPPESDFDAAGYRTELIQLAACCVSAVECLDYGTAGLGRTYGPEARNAA